jgi:hypothetical protein
MEEQFLCEGITRAGVVCSNRGINEVDGFHFCRIHMVIYDRARLERGRRPPERCHVISHQGNYCRNNHLPEHYVCERHLPPVAGWNEPQIAPLLADDIFARVVNDMVGLGPILLHPLPPPEVPFAADSQNVHRKEVSEQTNKATEFLLNVKLPSKKVQPTLWQFAAVMFIEFAGTNFRLFVDVIADVEHWLGTNTCRKKNDHLYCNLMYALIVYIKKSEHAEELWKRLWQECCDSLGMCCEGHISRLCNVLVGYVEGLDAPVSLGELTQQKMAAIAGQDIPEDDKRRMANEFFDTHGVPDADREAWLEAF